MSRPALSTGLLCLALCLPRISHAVDCNGNEIEDAIDLAPALKLRELGTTADVFFSQPVAFTSSTAMDVLAIEGEELVMHANDGNGAFERRRVLPNQIPVKTFAVADLNFDGSLDIAVLHRGRDGLHVYLGIRNRDFRAGPIVAFDERQSHLSVLDLEGDRDTDLLVGSAFLWHVFPVRNVQPHIQPLSLRVEPAVDIGGEVAAIAPGDLDGDGDVDAATVVLDLQGRVALLDNDGTGALSVQRSIGELGLPRDAVVFDLDSDLDLDVAMVDFGGLAYSFNDGQGAFQGLKRRSVFPERASSIASGDLDQDGNADLVMGLEDTLGLRTFLGRASQGVVPFEAFFGPRRFARLGHFDGDGAADIVFGGRSPGILFHQGRGRFGGHRVLVLEEDMRPSSLAAGDLDGDGDLDLAVASGTTEQVATHFLEDMEIVRRSRYLSGLQIDTLILEDIDGDGSPDITARDARTNRLWQTKNDGRGTYTVHASFRLSGEGPLLAADLNADAVSEYVLLDDEAIIVNQRAAAAEVLESTSYALAANPVALQAADFDLDGDLDIVTANSFEVAAIDADNASVLLNDGRGKLGLPRNYALDRGPARLAIADVDGDAALDLIASHPVSRSLLLLHGDGAGAFLRQTRFQLEGWIELLAPGDWDDDGALDLCFAERGEKRVSLTYGLGRELQLLPVIHETAQAPSSLLSVDFDGDGDDEVLVASTLGSSISLLDISSPPWSADEDGDGAPDECSSPRFRRGDVDANGRLELSDAVYLLRFLFLDGQPPGCAEAGDVIDDGVLNIGDPVSFLGYLYLGTFKPAAPVASCGAVPASRVRLGCEHPTGGCAGDG